MISYNYILHFLIFYYTLTHSLQILDKFIITWITPLTEQNLKNKFDLNNEVDIKYEEDLKMQEIHRTCIFQFLIPSL